MSRLRRFWRVLEQVVGGMDYVRYCEHVRLRHPEREVPTAREFYLSRISEKYSRPSRCC
jgi:uncharacterized short protein YbdD (DUF466 family)